MAAYSRTSTGTTGFRTTVILSGPFFAVDPGDTLQHNVHRVLEAMAAAGEADARSRSQASFKHPSSPSRFVGGIHGFVKPVKGGLPGQEYMRVAALYAYPWGGHTEEAGAASARMVRGTRAGAQYRGGKVERMFHMFRRTKADITKSRKLINEAALLKGLT